MEPGAKAIAAGKFRFAQKQRYWLEQAKLLARRQHSLIPEEKTYIQHRYVYEKQLRKLKLRSHALRHAYAQRRYQELTGWLPPIAGGPCTQRLYPGTAVSRHTRPADPIRRTRP